MPVAVSVELVPLKTTIYLSVRADSVDAATDRAVDAYKVFMSRLYQQDVGLRNLRAEMDDPTERKDLPGVFDAIAVMRGDVPTGLRVLGKDNYLDAYRQILRTTFAGVTRELEDEVHRKGSFIALTRHMVPGEEEQQAEAGEKPRRMIAVTAIVAGATHHIEINAEDTVLDGVLDKGIDMKFQCKAGVCDECQMHVLEGAEHLPPVNEAEVTMLGDKTKQGWRLSCQVSCTGPIKFEQP